MRRLSLAATVLFCFGCGNAGAGGDTPDMGSIHPGGMDLGMSPDLAPPPPDLTPVAACVPPSGGTVARFVWNSMRVPMERANYAIDLNGDHHPDNQLGTIDQAILSMGGLPQASVDYAVGSGQSITLM